jgi:hypothetical protein
VHPPVCAKSQNRAALRFRLRKLIDSSQFCGNEVRSIKLPSVTRVRAAVVVGAVLLWAVTPVIACVAPCFTGARLKEECPLHMAMQCPQAVVHATASCCVVSARPDVATLENHATQIDEHVLAVVASLSAKAPAALSASTASLVASSSPPNEASPPSLSVLRL